MLLIGMKKSNSLSFRAIRRKISSRKRPSTLQPAESNLFHITDGTLAATVERSGCKPANFPSEYPDQILSHIFEYVHFHNSPHSLLNCALVCKKWSRSALPLLTQACKVGELPDELILQILECTRNATPKSHSYSKHGDRTHTSYTQDLACCILTCKRWQRIAQPILHRDLVLHLNYTTSFYYQAYPQYSFMAPQLSWYEYHPSLALSKRILAISSVAEWIQTLSVELHFSERTKDQGESISLTNLLHDCLPKLRIFSLRAAPLRRDHPICRNEIAKIVEAVPETVTSLEVDLQGRDCEIYTTGQGPQRSLCFEIGEKLQTVKHLRIRLASICPAILNTQQYASRLPTSAGHAVPLESAVISIFNRTLHQRPTCCRSRMNRVGWRDIDIISKFEDLVQGNTFPNAKQFVTFASKPEHRRQDVALPQYEVKKYSFELEEWLTRSVVSTYGRYQGPLGFTLAENVAFLATEVMELDPAWIKYGQDADEWMEGDAAWSEDSNGARCPRGT